MKRMKQSFSPLPNNTIRFLVHRPHGGQAEVYQTTTLSEFRLIEGLVTSQINRRDKYDQRLSKPPGSQTRTTAQIETNFGQETQELPAAT